MENKKTEPKKEMFLDSEIYSGTGMVSKEYDRVVSRDGYDGIVKFKFDIQWDGYLIKPDLNDIIDDIAKQIKEFLFAE